MKTLIVLNALALTFFSAYSAEPLVQRAEEGNAAAFQAEFKKGATSFEALMALHVAISNGNKDIVRFLLEQGINPAEDFTLSGGSGRQSNALHHAVIRGDLAITAMLLAAGGDKAINHKPKHAPNLPLEQAVTYGTPEMVKLLLSYGADSSKQLSFVFYNRLTLKEFVQNYGRPEIAQLL